MFSWFRRRRRKKAQQTDWPANWTEWLFSNVRQCRLLDAPHMTRLQERVQVILAEKHWEAVDGLALTEEIQVTVAGQAALMLLGVDDFYFDNVPTIVLFPGSFERDVHTGVVSGKRHHVGEAWQGGPVILSWQDVLSGGRNPGDGHNVVIHEFAHTLDGIDGEMGGDVIFGDRATVVRWADVSQREFQALRRAAKTSQRTLLDHYGATNPAEFFAVASETFFELPRQLKTHHAELFDLLSQYYRLDPIQWKRLD
jgi:Mlc titration factor MtfA (ptsG expression regulator)